MDTEETTLIVWSRKYGTGIELIDKQHRELVERINNLYNACRRQGGIDAAFKEAMGHMVDYVRFHFAAEIKLLEKIKYPHLAKHKAQHDQLIRNILDASQNYSGGGTFIPNKFVRTLRDWVLSHIAIYDKAYAEYITEQMKNDL